MKRQEEHFWLKRWPASNSYFFKKNYYRVMEKGYIFHEEHKWVFSFFDTQSLRSPILGKIM